MVKTSTYGLPQRDDVLRVQSNSEAGIRLELVGFVDFPAGHRGKFHNHPFWEVIFIGGGRGVFHRDKTAEPCASNDIILIRPGERHQIRAGETDSLQQFYLGFSFNYTASNAANWTAPKVFPPGPLLDLIRSELRECHDRLRAQGNQETLESTRSRLMPVVSRMMGFLVAPAPRPDSHDHGRKEAPVQQAKEFLQANLRSPIMVREMARRFGLSPQYFGELFKKETGLTFKEYQTKIRTHRAMEMILDSDRTITAIAEEVGMDDLAYFSRVFKKQYQLSPRQLRQQGQFLNPDDPR